MAPKALTPYGSANDWETSSQLFADITIINGAGLQCTAYGVFVTLYFLAMSHLWAERKQTPRKTWTWMSFLTSLFINGTIINATAMIFTQDAFVNNRNYPGGSGEFEVEQFALPASAVSNVAMVIGLWLTDSLLVLRFYVILAPRWWWMILPSSMYLLTIAMSIVWMHQVVPPGGSLLNQTNANFTLVCWATSVANNVMITLGIVGYLLQMRFRIRRILGPLTRETIPYITVSAILIESAFLYTAFMLAFLIPLAIDSSVNCLFFQVIPQVQLIAPTLIVLRVAQGRSLANHNIQQTLREAVAESLRFRSDKSSEVSIATVPEQGALSGASNCNTMVISLDEENRCEKCETPKDSGVSCLSPESAGPLECVANH